ncbi:MAG: two-component sensor histidine kinase [Alphaproteobacteria bacterium]|nr:two-component sensor histidine kinase [Alphaproteobacteria bacterium]MBR3662447.1 two-component sensor histidine kinase [Alphaproteobacteria bacterium]
MHIKFPSRVEQAMSYAKKRFLPRSLFFRTMLLIFVPLIVVQVVSVYAYWNSSWNKVGRKLSDNLAQDMAFIIQADDGTKDFAQIQSMAEKIYDMKVQYYPNDDKHNVWRNNKKNNRFVTGFMSDSLRKYFPNANTDLFVSNHHDDLNILIDMDKGLYVFKTSVKNIFSTSIFGFVAWMIVTSLLLFVVAVLFLRVQARSITQLAAAAEDFGKGINTKFKPYGSIEVRRAGLAFVKMKERILRQISERTQMLAGVSHDLRTPLTRMKLQAAMMPDSKENQEFVQDIDEMEKMLDGYLSFVSGEGGEKSGFVDVNEMISSIINKYRKNTNALVRFSTNYEVSAIQGREQALRRAVTNIIENAFHYGQTVAVAVNNSGKYLEISVDDDGPGIPKDKRDDVFKAFYRVEGSRNKKTGGVGLGLAIAKDIVVSHGGSIELSDSEMGGLRVVISLPL